MSDPSAFLSLWQGARGLLDGAFAENFVITPMIQQGNRHPAPDPARESQSFTAGYLSPSEDQFGASPGHASNMGQKAVTSHPNLIVSVEALPYRPSPPDIIMRQSTGEVFDVAKVMPDGYGRLVLDLTNRRGLA